jgi:hypothetical protein
MTIKMDPIAAQTAEAPSRFDRIEAAIMRVANSAPPAQRAAIKRMEEIGYDEALRLLESAKTANGNGVASEPTSEPPR